MALAQPTSSFAPRPAARPEPSGSATPAAAALDPLLASTALAALAPAAAGVPAALWRRALLAPIDAIASRPGKGFRARLSDLAFRLGGGRGEPPAALAGLFEVLHMGSMIVDDIEDDSRERRGAPAVHCQHGVPLALNAGNWMYFAPLARLPELGLPAATELRLYQRMTRVLLDCHFGQALDLGAQLHGTSAADVHAVVATASVLKTGRLLGLAAEAAALVAGAAAARTAALAAFGEALGVGLQMLDDLGNLAAGGRGDKRFEDLRQGRVTWAWAWAAARDPAAFTALVEERARVAAEVAASKPTGEPETCHARDAHAPHAAWAPLAARLRRLVEDHGRREAHAHLQRALGDLRAEVGEHPLLPAVAREIARLEASYG